MQLNDVKAVISGGASGLGLATARLLRGAGAQVALLDINDDAGAAAVDELGGDTIFVNTDVRSEEQVVNAIDKAVEALGGINVAVACAGIIGAGRALGREAPMALDFFANVININLIGTFNLNKAAAAAMCKNEPNEEGERGVIVNTASVAAYEGQIGQAAYSASKGGVVGLTLPLAREFTRFGIRVNSVAPGVFHTPMVEGMPEHVYESLCAGIPFPSRLGRPEEYADTVAFMITNAYVNGTTIRVDGAVRLAPK